MNSLNRIRVIDSHTGGEPTRVVISGGPKLGGGPLAEQRLRFEQDFDHFRSAIVNEPRGSDPVVGALLVEPFAPDCVAGVIFFNNVGSLGMCGHGTIGLMVTLAHMGRISAGTHRIDTPVGVIEARLDSANRVSLRNVRSFRTEKQVEIDVPQYGKMHGDVAWGGNWFFLVEDHGQTLELANINQLTDCATEIRQTLQRQNIRGEHGAEIDHIELVGPSAQADARNFVLCPGLAYDRSPCGTGTSAKLACLHADGLLKPGDTWRQESVIGSIFEGSLEYAEGGLRPRISGEAFITAEAELIIDPADPFAWGIRR